MLPTDFEALYAKYDDEIARLASRLRALYHSFTRRADVVAFSDVEGEVLYMLIREARPETVFEISPAAGWSTNYILAALTANRKGRVHSFEMTGHVGGRPTEAVIRSNQHPDWDQTRLVVHIGDAMQTAPRVEGPIDFLLLDSCHDDWFARWYITSLFPRVRGPVVVQDIAFVDDLESSSEAREVWSWVEKDGIPVTLIGAVEAAIEATPLRAAYAERRSFRSNAILFSLPRTGRAELPRLADSVHVAIERAETAAARGDVADGARRLNAVVWHLMRDTRRVLRYRDLIRVGRAYRTLGEHGEAQRCFRRSLGFATQHDPRTRAKAWTELVPLFVGVREWKLALQTAALIALEPRAYREAARSVRAVVHAVITRS